MKIKKASRIDHDGNYCFYTAEEGKQECLYVRIDGRNIHYDFLGGYQKDANFLGKVLEIDDVSTEDKLKILVMAVDGGMRCKDEERREHLKFVATWIGNFMEIDKHPELFEKLKKNTLAAMKK
jgi:hypothetical protein